MTTKLTPELKERAIAIAEAAHAHKTETALGTKPPQGVTGDENVGSLPRTDWMIRDVFVHDGEVYTRMTDSRLMANITWWFDDGSLT